MMVWKHRQTLRTIPFLIAVCLFAFPAHAKYSGGTGEPNDPYQIATAADLITLGETPQDYDKHFLLTADIDLDPNLPGRRVFNEAVIAPDANDANGWFDGTAFTGVFDGNRHTISHPTVQAKDFVGLFGQLDWGAEVKNLGVMDVNMTGSGHSVGGLLGYNCGGTLTNCCCTGVVGGTASDVGGLVGYDYWGSMTECYSTGAVNGLWGVGGLIGRMSGYVVGAGGRVTQSYSAASVRGKADVGGLIGHSRWSVVTQCYSIGRVNGEYLVGGLAGSTDEAAVTMCFWDIQTSGQTTSAGGTGKSTAEMQTAKTFLDAGWDFVGETANGSEDIWKIAEGLGYPRLSWEKYSGGTGEPNDPYQIATAADLIALGETPADYDKHFVLTADIDLDPNLPGRKVFDKAVIAPDTDPGDSSWGGPLFTGPSFAGVFDGHGHVIHHLAMVGKDYVGLFGECSGTVKNAAVVDVNITGSGEQVGGLVGCNSGTVTQCSGTGVVDGNEDVGGLVGFNSGIVTQCHSTGAATGGKGVGGLVGYNFSIVTDCYSTCEVIGGWYVGGLAGYNVGHMADCYGAGAVGGWYYVGGLVGYNGGGIFRCYSTGSVDAPGDFGGLVEPSDSGGLVGDGYGDVIGCFWDTQTSGRDVSCGGAGQPTGAMQNVNVYLDAGWDFVGEAPNGTHEIWQMPQGGGYPVLSVFNGYTPPKLQGSGTPDHPYLISDARELGAIVSYSLDASYQLTASIDLSGIRWNRTVIPWFAGTFDGNGQTISHLTIAGEGLLGLFGQLASGAEVKDLGVVGGNITGSSSWIGGLVGWVDRGSVTHCYSTGLVQATDSYVGGLVGCNSGTLTRCHSTIAVAGDESLIGGLETFFGGLVGSNLGSITQCYSDGTVNGRGSGGGLVGAGSGCVTQCYSRSAVTGTGCLGGLVGNNAHGNVSQCYSTGSVSGDGWCLGGLIGGIDCCDHMGCICIAVVAGSMWDVETSGQTASDGGTGKTTAEMQTAETFLDAGWDLVGETANGTEDIWWILEGKGYPRLWWEQGDEASP